MTMIFGNIYNAFFAQQAAVLPKPLRAALNYLKSVDLIAHETGHFPVELDGVPMILQVMDLTAMPRSKKYPEIHRKYIDLQMFVAGEPEKTTWFIDRGGCAVHDDQLNTANDILFYENDSEIMENAVFMTPGDYAFYFPWDVHVPGQPAGTGCGRFRKIVMKVPVDSCIDV